MFITWSLGVLLVGFGGYIAGYLRKKGENVAIHEDIDKLVDQVSAVTKATKGVEAKINSDLWDRQKRWELKREVLFEAARRISEVEEALLSIATVLQVEREKHKVGQPGWMEAKLERHLQWSKASAAFDETRLFVGVTCTEETIEAFETFGALTTGIATKVSQDDTEIYPKSRAELIKKRLSLMAALRRELGTKSDG